MDDFGPMPGEQEVDSAQFRQQLMTPIPELRGLLVNRMNVMPPAMLAVLDGVMNPQVAEAMKMILPEISDILDQIAQPGPAQGAQQTSAGPAPGAQPMPGMGGMAPGGMGPVPGAADEYERQAQPQFRRPSPLSAIQG